MLQFNDLRQELSHYLSHEKVDQIEDAYLVAEQAHKGQKRRTGEPYIVHPLEVAQILAIMRMDEESIMAAMLHDVLEDTEVDKQTLVDKFGANVAELVDGVSKLTQIKFENRAEAQAENFRKMLLAMVRDIRVILVKLADRLHNMRTLGALSVEKRRRIARETLEIYAPIAHRLGMNQFRIEFEKLGFAALYPWRCKTLQEAVRKARGNRKEIISMIEAELISGLEKHGLTSDCLQGREKPLYSVYQKMRKKNLSFSQIMDFYGFRIVVDSIDECYRVIGIVHRLYKPVPGRFKDYIAIPKANGYKSLHTTLFGPYGVPIEIQIRTHEMEHLAEQGIAAHWLYKSPEASITQAQESARTWLKSLLEFQQQNVGNSIEFMNNVKIDLFPDDVYVFTPKGDIMELPTGATAVDFAYAVHTDIGNSCVAARIDRQLAPLSLMLYSGQTVEIITAPGTQPNPAWLNFVVSGKARSNIRHYIKSQKQSESMLLGKRLLDSALSTINANIDNIAKSSITQYLKESQCDTLEDLYVDIGLGQRTGLLVAQRLVNLESARDQKTWGNMQLDHSRPLSIKGTEGIVVNFAKCCWPIPGDHIIGILGEQQGLTIHLELCKKIANLRESPDKCIPVIWDEGVDSDFQVEIKIELINERGMLATLAATISDMQANIDSIHTENIDSRYSIVTMILAVSHRDHLAHIMRRIRTLKRVVKIMRSR